MRSRLTEASTAAVFVTLALVACHPSAQDGVGTTQTTNAVVIVAPSAPAPSSPLPAREAERVVDEPSLPEAPPSWSLETNMSMDSDADSTPPYALPPLHEPNGSRGYGDVGMPYPLPSAPVDEAGSPRMTRAPTPEPQSFPETSFGPPIATPGFPESSFGADGGL